MNMRSLPVFFQEKALLFQNFSVSLQLKSNY